MTTKLPPQAPELEQSVLGALLIEKEALREMEGILRPEDFYIPANREIYRAITRLDARHEPVDMLTVTEELKRMKKLDECGGTYYIAQLCSMVAGSSHLEYHARIVQQKAYARNLISITAELLDEAYDPAADIYELQEQFEQKLTALATGNDQPTVQPLEQVLRDTIAGIGEREEIHKAGGLNAIPTGLPSLDKALNGGWHNTDLNILGARPSMGKTQFALFFAKTAAQHGKNTMIVSVESGDTQLATRYLLEDERISPSHLRTGQMTATEWEALDETAGKLWHLPLYIAADHMIRKLSYICSTMRRQKRRQGLDIAIIDYVGLIRTGGGFQNRYLEIGYITSELKNLAKELKIPILLLCQLSRPLKGMMIQKPKLEDLRESGDIEQDADNVLFLHKKSYYDPDATDADGRPLKNRGELIIAKQREGERNISIPFQHDARYKKIREPE